MRDGKPIEGLKPCTSAKLHGRTQQIANGCVYCHSQQPRAKALAPDFERGWSRATMAGDYAAMTRRICSAPCALDASR